MGGRGGTAGWLRWRENKEVGTVRLREVEAMIRVGDRERVRERSMWADNKGFLSTGSPRYYWCAQCARTPLVVLIFRGVLV